MSVHIDVVAEMNRKATQQAAQQIQREFGKAAQNAGKDFDKILSENMTGGMSKFNKQMDKVVEATAKLHGEETKLTNARKQAKAATDARSSAEERLAKAIEATGKGSYDAVQIEKELSTLRKQEQRNLAALEAQSRRLAQARRDEARASRDAASVLSDDGSGSGGGGIGFGGGRRGGRGGRFASPGMVHAATLGVGTMPAAALAAANLAGALQQLSGAALVVPGALAGISSTVGVAALGMFGMSDAFDAVAKASDGTKASVDAANEALSKLSPAAAEVVKTTMGLKGTFTDLRDIASENMFAGISDQITELAQRGMPTLTKGVDGISKALNDNLSQALKSLGSDSSLSIMDRIFGNTANAQGRLSKAIDPIIEGIGTLAAAGSDSLPRLADAVGAVADRFNTFITGADADGRLSMWINEGLSGMTDLGNAALNIGKSITAITQAAGTGGFLQWLREATMNMSTFLNSTDGQQKLSAFFDEGRVMAGKLMDTARELGPVLKGAFDAAHEAAGMLLPIIQDVLDLINSIPGGAQTVVSAFLAWKSIQGVGALASSLTSISNLLKLTLPASAASGASGISAALAGITVPAWLSALVAAGGLPAVAGGFILGANEYYKANDPGPTNENARARGAGGMADRIANGGVPTAPQYAGGGGSFGPPSILRPDGTFGPGSLGGPAGASAERRPRGAVAATGPEVPDITGWNGMPITEPGGGVSDSDRRATIRAGLDPAAFAVDPFSAMAQVPGFVPGRGNQDQIQAQQRAQSEAWDVQEAAMDLAVLQQDSLATQQEINDAKRKLTEEGWQLDNAQAALYESMTGKAKDFKTGMEELGTGLDADLGISKGLPGIADNIVRFVASLAAAPLMGQLNAISNANPNQGSGIIGMAASQGVFGQQYTPGAIAASGGGSYSTAGYASPSNMGPAALQPRGAYPGDAALLANVPAGRYAQVQNADLTQGLADCSSAVEDLVNLLDDKPTGGRSMSTHNAADWLTSRGFLPGTGGPGDFRVGYNSSHMQATLPGGTPFNWGSDSSAARGGVGGSGAFDPAFTDHYYRPAAASAPGLYSAQNTSPALTPVSSGGGSGSLFGLPIPQSPVGQLPHLPGALGQSAMPGANGQGMAGVGASAQSGAQMSTFNAGQQPTGGTGGGFTGMGGMPMDAALGAAGMLDMIAPGAGAGAQIGMKLANRAIGQMGQYAGIATSGVLETLSVGNTPLSNPSKSWLGKLAGGFAGARPNLPNSAGGVGGQQAQPKDAQQPGQHQGTGQPPGPTNGVYIENYQVGETEDRAGADLARHQQAGALAGMNHR